MRVEIQKIGGEYYCGDCGGGLFVTRIRDEVHKGVQGAHVMCMTWHCPRHNKRYYIPAERITAVELEYAQQVPGTSQTDASSSPQS